MPRRLHSSHFLETSRYYSAQLTTVFNSFLDSDSLTPNILWASVVMLPKPDKDTAFWASFHLISVVNIDIKILAIINKINNTYKDQVGLVLLREAPDNI